MDSRAAERNAYDALLRYTRNSYAELSKIRGRFDSWRCACETLLTPATKPEMLPNDIRLVLREEQEFPAPLREIPHPPFGLYLKGALPSFGAPWIALVGTRRATPEGKRFAREFASQLSRAGCVIVSGLALGIDAAAHEGALGSKGATVAVLGTGLSRVYPRTNERLGERIIAEGGALLSEYPPEAPALPYQFLERNRIVSGLCTGVLVIEAPARSGSLATARFALEQNRDVWVIPGSIRHPNYEGSHRLIREGAALVTRPEDILEELGAATAPESIETQKLAQGTDRGIILRALHGAGRALSANELVAATGLSASALQRELALLVIENGIKEEGGRYFL